MSLDISPSVHAFSPPEHRPSRFESELAEVREQRYDELFAQAMRGEGEFWNVQRLAETEDWVVLIGGMVCAQKIIGVKPADRHAITERALVHLVDEWARREARKAQ